MTPTIGLTEARERLTEILERVVDGEQMVVTRYGSPVAAIVPVPAELDDDRPLGLGAFAGAAALAAWPLPDGDRSGRAPIGRA